MINQPTFSQGIKHGIPIALGYFVVSFTYGMMATLGGLSPWEAILISMTNLTSAGQFAGTNILIAGGSYLEIILSMLVINSRYALMSASLSQRLSPRIPLIKKSMMSFGITDETFTVASVEAEEVTFPYFMGLITLPYWGWAFGTITGAFTDNLMSAEMQNAASIALYCMFIALFIPAAKKHHAERFVVVITAVISCFLFYVPFFTFISNGYKIIIAAVISSLITAKTFTIKKEDVLS